MPHGRRAAKIALIVAALAVFIAVPAFLAIRLRAPSFYVTGDPLDIRLHGVILGGSRDILGPTGKKIGETFGSWRNSQYTSQSQGWIKRTYVFDVPPTKEDVTFDREQDAHASGVARGQIGLGCAIGAASNEFPDDGRLYCSMNHYDAPHGRILYLPYISKFLYAKLKSIDITLGYWQGPRGKAAMTFMGPFAAAKTCSPEGGGAGALAVSNYYGTGNQWGIQGQLTAPMLRQGVSSILVYDKAGKRELAYLNTGWMVAGGASGTCAIFTIPNRNPEDIAAITVNETKRERTFHYLPVVIRGFQERTYPDYLDAVADRLQLKSKQRANLRSFSIDSNEQALKVIDLLHGWDAQVAWGMIWSYILDSPDRRDSLSGDDLRRLRLAADAWSKADDTQVRGQGIAIGLALSPQEFIPAALAYLENTPAETPPLAVVPERCAASLRSDDIRRMKALVAKTPKNWALIACLVACPLPEASQALRELAADDETSAWWQVFHQGRAIAALGPTDSWPDALKIHSFIVGNTTGVDFSSEKAAASALMPSLLTEELMRSDPEAFAGICRRMAECCDRGTAEELTVRLLRNATAYNESIAPLVKAVNLWNNVNIAGLGHDVDTEVNAPNGRNWRQIARDAVEWLDTGKVRVDVPDGYRVTKDDLRIVAYDPSDTENALIGIWRPCVSQADLAREHAVWTPGAYMTYSIKASTESMMPKPAGPRFPGQRPSSDYDAQIYACWFGSNGETRSSTGGGQSFAVSQLPVTLMGGGEGKTVVERADSPESVLSGTKVFDEWWKTHGSADPEPDIESSGQR